MDSNNSIETIKGVGPAVSTAFSQVGVRTIKDLINYFPRRYDDYSNVQKILDLNPGTAVTIEAVVTSVSGRYVRRGLHITEAIARDESGSIKVVWFNQPYRAAAIKPGEKYYLSGSFELSRGRLSLMNPNMELASSFPVNTARIVPIYRETKGLKSATVRKLMREIAPIIRCIVEILPADIVKTNKLIPYSDALMSMHFPENNDQLGAAKRRLGFDELFCLSLASLLNKRQFQSESGVHIEFDEKLIRSFVDSLPFPLTNAQRKVSWQIFKDMERTEPMNRLVEGDVGSGKTVVGAMAALAAMNRGYQVAFMAPTEILAAQHFKGLSRLLARTDFSDRVSLLVGSLTAAQKRQEKLRISSGEVSLIVGTHALITDDVDLRNLGLVIIDEQHRFGVKQRKKLQEKAGKMPHVLSMTATPIPRTLALTVYGELDISVIDEMPPGRQTIYTTLVSPNSRKKMHETIAAELAAGKQVFVVCPLIEDSEKIPVYSAEKVYKQLSESVYKSNTVALLHGKMKPAEKDEVMAKFVEGEIDILVSTTVVEVGVDVPNASVMVIEAAERFGLAQLHQLRGRVGRGVHQSYCYLVMSDSKEPPKRLKSMEKISNGFELAEIDLELRGPGAIYGVVQSGQLDLKIANITDVKLISQARSAAAWFIDEKVKLSEFPEIDRVVAKNRAVTNLN